MLTDCTLMKFLVNHFSICKRFNTMKIWDFLSEKGFHAIRYVMPTISIENRNTILNELIPESKISWQK